MKNLLLILFILIIVCFGCTQSSPPLPHSEDNSSSPSESNLPPTPKKQIRSFDSVTPDLAKLVFADQFDSGEEPRFQKAFNQNTHEWLDQFLRNFNQLDPKQINPERYCRFLKSLPLSSEVRQAHKRDSFSFKEYPLWYWNKVLI